VDDAAAEIHLKLENLQPIGSFKLRGAGNAMASAAPPSLAHGVYTASAGNMAQRGVDRRVIVPSHAPETKLAAIARLGGTVVRIPFDEWWQVLVDHGSSAEQGMFIHPVSDPAVIAGNGTIGLEILEDLPDVDAIVVPYGGGGLSCGIASAVRALEPRVKVFAAEVATAAPFAASLAAGEPRTVEYQPSFVDGIGARSVLREMWPLASRLLEASLVVPLVDIAATIRLLAERNHVVAEGAGAAAVAAAQSGRAGRGKVACIVSGGNIDAAKLAAILAGELP
jgi:threonine dehydratase